MNFWVFLFNGPVFLVNIDSTYGITFLSRALTDHTTSHAVPEMRQKRGVVEKNKQRTRCVKIKIFTDAHDSCGGE